MNFFLDAITNVDITIYHFFNGYAGNWLLDRIINHAESNNFFKGGLFLAAYAYIWFRRGPEQEKRRRAIIAILVGTLLTLVVTRTIANLAPFRIRPMYNLEIPHRLYSFPLFPNMQDWSSFPSDTAAYFVALAFGLAYLWRSYTVPIVLYTAGWICLPRLFLGLHYASDLVVGGAVGITMVWAALRAEWLTSGLATRVLALRDAKPEIFYSAAFLACFEMGVLFQDVRYAARSVLHVGLAWPYTGLFPAVLVVSALVCFVLLCMYVVIRVWGRRPVLSGRLGSGRAIGRRNARLDAGSISRRS